MTKPIAVLAGVSPERPSHLFAKDTLMLVTALLANNRRVLVQATSELLAPLVFAANAFRSATVVESPERAPSPVCLLPMPGNHESIRWLFRPLGDRSGDGRVSLLDMLAATGAIDVRWFTNHHEEELEGIFEKECPEAFVAIGGSQAMKESFCAAQNHAGRHRAGLFVVGARSQVLSQQENWLDLHRAAGLPEVTPLYQTEQSRRKVDEEEMMVHEEAIKHASVSIAAEWLATHSKNEWQTRT